MQVLLDEHPLLRKKLLLGLPRQFRKIFQRSLETDDVERHLRIEKLAASAEVMRHAPKADAGSARLHLQPSPLEACDGRRLRPVRPDEQLLPQRKVLSEIRDEPRPLMTGWNWGDFVETHQPNSPTVISTRMGCRASFALAALASFRRA
jgi:hypothetical protein